VLVLVGMKRGKTSPTHYQAMSLSKLIGTTNRQTKFGNLSLPQVSASNSVVINNSALVGKDINPVTYEGVRLQALYQFNDSWGALLAQTYQSMEADGVFAEATVDSLGVPQPPLTTQLFNPSSDKDPV
jgi:hypothetical protein